MLTNGIIACGWYLLHMTLSSLSKVACDLISGPCVCSGSLRTVGVYAPVARRGHQCDMLGFVVT